RDRHRPRAGPARRRGRRGPCRPGLRRPERARDRVPDQPRGSPRGPSAPPGPGVRGDTHVFRGYPVPPFYDSLIAKVIVWGEDRPTAIARARRALSEFELEGVPTTRPLAMEIIETENFVRGAYTPAFLG